MGKRKDGYGDKKGKKGKEVLSAQLQPLRVEREKWKWIGRLAHNNPE